MSTNLQQAPNQAFVSEPVRQTNYSTNFLNPLLATPSLQYSDNRQKLAQLKELFNYRFSLYEELFLCMTEKAYYKRADKLRHPLIFYYGHTAVFFMNKLIVSGVLSPKDRINPYFEQVMAIGVDEMSWDDLLSDDYKWPPVSEVKDYRDLVRKVVNDVIDNKILMAHEGIITWENKLWVVLMGIEHEAIHLETSAVLIRQLPLEVLVPYPKTSVFSNDFQVIPQNPEDVSPFGFVKVPESEVTLGRPFSLETADPENKSNYVPIYGWDNEFGKHTFKLKEFHLADRLVSNADFLHFVNEKGYETERFWSPEGWKWVQYTKSTKPLFWVLSEEGTYALRKMASIEPSMPWSWPVEINSLEATAFLRYYKEKHHLNVRLPSEAEYHTVLKQSKYFQETNNKIFPQNFNIALRYSSSCPNHLYKEGDFFDLVGNVWQWTNTTMYPYKGFKVHPTYDDFTEPTFDDRHNLFKGGSWVSISNEANIFCRYAFRRHFFQFAGFRVACSFEPSEIEESINMNDCSSILPLESAISTGNPYETDELANQYCEQHYGPQVLPYFERHTNVCARLCEHLLVLSKKDPQQSRILDLGCGVGRTTFELGRNFGAAVGVDFSTRFIQVALQLKEKGRMRYKIPIEGEIFEFREASFDSENFHLTEPQESPLIKSLFGDLPSSFTEKKPLEEIISKVNFLQADACNLSQTHRLLKDNFDIILFSNVLDRLYDPLAFLNSVHQRIVPGGFLVITSPYTWLTSYVSQQNWVGGFKKDGENVFSVENLKIILSTWFDVYVFTPADPNFKDSFKLHTNVQNFRDQNNPQNPQENYISSFHIPAVSRETLRKYELIYSECSIWRRKTI